MRYFGDKIKVYKNRKHHSKHFSDGPDPVCVSADNVSSLTSDCDLKGVKSTANEKTRSATVWKINGERPSK